MKFISWNVNGLRACIKKGFFDFFNKMDADIFAIQESKMKQEQKDFDVKGYFEYWSSAIKPGYSGTVIFSKIKPIDVIYGIDGKYNDEGRIITLEFDNYYFICLYSPNSKDGLLRLPYRMDFEDDLRNYLTRLNKKKSVVLCGDLNVAHKPIDLKNPKANERNAGYTIEERNKFDSLLNSGFIDSFRYLNPDKIQYTWWSYRFNARKNNAGWRIDYFIVSDNLKDKLNNFHIHDDVLGSDHCPIELNIDL